MDHSGTLYVVATPIGNLGDVTLRALDTLKAVAWVAAEDTRHSGRLLAHFGIGARLLALHEHNERRAGEKVLQRLAAGESVALITDAGTPGVSDPGAVLVDMAHAAGMPVVPIPGPCAAVTALSVAGFAHTRFLFLGFLPATRAQRRSALDAVRENTETLLFHEAPHRIVASVQDMAAILGEGRRVLLARELTKTFETLHRCTLGEAVAWIQADANRQRGEFVLVVEGATAVSQDALMAEVPRVLKVLLAELPVKQAVKLAAEITGARKNTVYALALEWEKAVG